MTIAQLALLGFAAWTVVTLLATVGVYRWSRILTGRVNISAWRPDLVQGSEWYQRAMRAHLNCVENLPVFAAIVYCATVADAGGALVSLLAVLVVAARVGQTTVHLAFVQTDTIVSVRFGFFLVQILSMLAMAVLTAIAALAR